MKKHLGLILPFLILALSCSQPRVHKKAPQPQNENDLVTGCYYISETPNHLLRTLPDKTNPEQLYIMPTPIVTIGNFETVESKEEYGSQVLTVRLNAPGKLAFASATEAMKGKRLAVIIDNKLIMAPVVQDRIEGGSFNIAGNFSKEEIEQLKALLEAGMYEPK